MDSLLVFVPSLLGPPTVSRLRTPGREQNAFRPTGTRIPRWGRWGSKFACSAWDRFNCTQIPRQHSDEWPKSARLALDQPKDNVAQAFAGAAQDREHPDAAPPSERRHNRASGRHQLSDAGTYRAPS
jgi:hypothetical protein